MSEECSTPIGGQKITDQSVRNFGGEAPSMSSSSRSKVKVETTDKEEEVNCVVPNIKNMVELMKKLIIDPTLVDEVPRSDNVEQTTTRQDSVGNNVVGVKQTERSVRISSAESRPIPFEANVFAAGAATSDHAFYECGGGPRFPPPRPPKKRPSKFVVKPLTHKIGNCGPDVDQISGKDYSVVLNEFVHSMRFLLSEHTTAVRNNTGLPLFSCVLTLEKDHCMIISEGYGSQKRFAKRQAACIMIGKLRFQGYM